MKIIRLIMFTLLLFPVFSLTQILGLPRLNNVIFCVFLIGLLVICFKKIKIDENLIYSWLIGFGLGLSLLAQFIISGKINYSDFVFPLSWLLFPFFLRYWKNISLDYRLKFGHWFFFINFLYSFIQIFLSRVFGYSLMLHRTFTDYRIETYAQDTPFSYLGLNNIHQFISNNLGAAVTGLMVERIDLMLICLLCLLRCNIFNQNQKYQSRIKNQSEFYRLLKKINICSAIILLTITGSSISLVVILLPFFFVGTHILKTIQKKIKFKIFSKSLSPSLRVITSLFLGLCIFVLFSLYIFPYLTVIILEFDASSRISSLVQFQSLSENFIKNINLLMFGAGIVSTDNLTDLTNFRQGDTLLPRSLDILGYTFNSFGLVGFLPFILCYPIILSQNTILKKETIIFFCLFAFVGAGSPISYIYIYAIILSLPKQSTSY